MQWLSSTEQKLTECFNVERYKPWSDAVGSKKSEQCSEPLDELLERLSSILVSELTVAQLNGCSSEEAVIAMANRMGGIEKMNEVQEKILKFLDMAALAGKTL